MSGILPSYVFTDADMVDIRRFCGYPPYGTGAVSFVERFTRFYIDLDTRISNMTADEAAVVSQKLVDLRTLEAAVPASGANLDTDQAAVWFHNKNEVRDRMALFNMWRMQLCADMGVPPGPYLRTGVRIVVT